MKYILEVRDDNDRRAYPCEWTDEDSLRKLETEATARRGYPMRAKVSMSKGVSYYVVGPSGLEVEPILKAVS